MGESAVISLIEAIRTNPGINADELARRFGVGARTVRNRVRAANDVLEGGARISFQRRPEGDGYYLEVLDQELFAGYLDRTAASRGSSIPQSSPERVRYLLDDLLSRSDWVTLDVLAEILYVSRASISLDLKKVEAILSENGLVLERRPRYGIRVTGPELNRRRCLAAAVAPRVGSDGEGPLAEDLGQRLALDTVTRCLKKALIEKSFAVNQALYRNVIVHVAIALLRSGSGGPLPLDQETVEKARSLSAFDVARRVAELLEEKTGVHLPDEEVAYIAIHLAGRQVVSADGQTADERNPADGPGRVIISQEIWDVVERMLDAVYQMYHFELRDDLELRMNLARHVLPLSVRLQYAITLDNPLLDEIKAAYPFAYSMAVEASGVLADAYGTAPTDDEIGYVALSFALALERKKTGCPRKRVLVVCGSGMASANLLAFRLERDFGAFLECVEVSDLAGLDQRDLSGFDYVFTTVPVPYDIQVPQLMVSLLLDERDRRGVERALKAEERAASMAAYCPEELFFAHLRCGSKDEALSALCDRVRAFADVGDDFERLVRQREDVAPTSFGNRVAIPHPLHPVGEKTFVAVGLLDEPIPWNGEKVMAVFLLSIADDPQEDLQGFYRPLARMWISEGAIDRLLAERTYQAFLDELQGGEDNE